MPKFRDNKDRLWLVEIDVNAVRRVRDAVGIDLLNVFDPQLVGRLSSDPVLLVDTIWAVCRPEAERNQITDEEFGARLVGDAIDQALTALLEGIADFFPQPRRSVLKAALRRVTEAAAEAGQRAEAALEALDVRAIVARTFGDSSTSSPASSASIPAA